MISSLNLDSNVDDVAKSKPQKRRAPLLLKRKALTTGFFDSSKIKNDGKVNSGSGGLIFGQPLEKCLSNDISKLATKNQSGGNKSGRSSRSSISSLLDSQFGTGAPSGKEAVITLSLYFTSFS